MSNVAWTTEHTVETEATATFAWTYMTEVKNWNDPPAQFNLEGPFAVGSHGTTQMPGQPPRYWQLKKVEPIESYTIELLLEQASMSFEWQFHSIAGGRTRLTQRVALQGENASAYLPGVQEAFGLSLAAGMSRVAAAIDKAYSTHNDVGRCERPSESR